jgi:hypothetical protein
MIRKNIRLAVILQDGKRHTKIVRAPAGRQFTDPAVDAVLDNEAQLIEKFFPGREFRLVPLDKGFNFVEIAKEAEAS